MWSNDFLSKIRPAYDLEKAGAFVCGILSNKRTEGSVGPGLCKILKLILAVEENDMICQLVF